MIFTWTAWNNGSPSPTGAGYGLKVPEADRDTCFDRSWKTVTVELPGGVLAEPNVGKASFWKNCRELIDVNIGRWFVEKGHAPWPKGRPPKVQVEQVGERHFRVMGVVARD